MIIDKIFEVTMIISNPINFCINKKQHIMTELNNTYLHKCFMGSYIIDITDIIQMSSCKIISTNSSGHGTIDVRFSAMVYILNTWDILIGVEIERNQSLIVGKYKRHGIEVDVTLKPTDIQANTLTTKQLIPVRIVKAIHKPKFNQISTACILMTCDKKSINYRIKGEISKSALTDINFIIDRIKEELKLRTELMDTKRSEIMFFESLLYSYKFTTKETEIININDQLTYEGPINNVDNILIKNLFDLIVPGKDLTGYWSRPLGIYRSSPLVAYSVDKPAEYILTAPHLMIIDISKSMLNYLIAIREFVDVYNTPDIIKSHENIWNMLRQVQM